MPTSISFTDGIGAATLTNGQPFPADRFDNWTPSAPFNGDAAYELGSKRRHGYSFGDVYGVTFQLSKVPNTSQAVALRLKRHLMNGGTCSVSTGDSASRTYPTCGLAEGAEPGFELTDRVERWYTLSLALVNVADVPTEMICIY